jgi:hypothetical protein
MHMEPQIGIGRLVGEELNVVAFVMDYVEFHFNGPVLRALTQPRVVDGGGSSRFPEPGSRDRLCGLIGKTVATVSVIDDVAIEIAFSDGAQLHVPLDDASRVGAEAAHFQSETVNSPLFMVW